MAKPTASSQATKKVKRKVPKGVVHIQATYNNTIVTVSTPQGGVVAWSSAGACGFRGARKSTPFAAKTAAEAAAKKCLEQGRREARVYVWGPGPGRETAIRGVHDAGLRVTLIRDITALPHNGCRPPKRRRVLVVFSFMALSQDPIWWNPSPYSVSLVVIEHCTLENGERYAKILVGPVNKEVADLTSVIVRRLARSFLKWGDRFYKLTEIRISWGSVPIRGIIPGFEQDVETIARVLAKINRYPSLANPTGVKFGSYRASLFVQGTGVLTAGDFAGGVGLLCDDPTHPVAFFKDVKKQYLIQYQVALASSELPLRFPYEIAKHDGTNTTSAVVVPSGRNPVRSISVSQVDIEGNPNECNLIYERVTDGSVTPYDVVLESYKKGREFFSIPLGAQTTSINLFNRDLFALSRQRREELDLTPGLSLTGKPLPYTLKRIRACDPVFTRRGQILIANLRPSAECLARLDTRNIPCLSSFVIRYLEQVQTPTRPEHQRIPKECVEEILKLLSKAGRPIQDDYEDRQPE
jgi:small subunit ribosomal protein S11